MSQIMRARIHERVACPLALLLTLLLVSCSGPRLDRLDRPVAETGTAQTRSVVRALERSTRETLGKEDLLALYREDAREGIRVLAERHRHDPTEARRLALVEMSLDEGDRQTGPRPLIAMGHYLDGASLCERQALAFAGRAVDTPDQQSYNYVAARLARLLHEQPRSEKRSVTVPGVLRPWRLSLARGEGQVDPRDYDYVAPVSWLSARGINWEHVTQEGFGAAMVGHRAGTPERLRSEPAMPPSGFGFPLNASLRFSGDETTLVLQDVMETSVATVRGRRVPLKGDFTAALAFMYHEGRQAPNKFAAMFRPGRFEDAIQMVGVQPFDPDRIPLVLVHGLASTAESWLPFVNLLLGDPVVREQYQIYLFNYPNGNPIERNAADLREGLADLREDYDPKGQFPKMRRMVIVGHSMGGIISNMQIRDAGDQLFDKSFTRSLEELGLDAESEAALRQALFFEANPDIDRAILMAAPFRGSAFASNRIGQLGAWLIRAPFDLVDTLFGQIEFVDAMTDVAQEASQRPPNSVNSLRPDNPLLHNVLELPVRPGVDIHTIIARWRPRVPVEESSDGVVTYASAHLDEAVSEKIIDGYNHRRMVEAESTLEEVWRILALHAGVKRTPRAR